MTEGKVLGPKIYYLKQIMTFVLSMLVGMLCHPTRLLFFKFFIFSLSPEWMFDEFDSQGIS